MRKRAVVLAGCVAGAALLAGQALVAQKTKGKTRLAATKQIMAGIMQPNCSALVAAFKGTSPADDKGWQTAAQQAALLNEVGYLLMDDGRCPDAVWAGAAKTLREGSAAVLDAVGKKDAAAANTAIGTMTSACKSCHTAHKGK
ncbi:MAG: hypothetical protein FJW26_06550 [Acidimicrobiia bacterium]|nr:hypothetical protein [Acidimicrobiia bacterium]